MFRWGVSGVAAAVVVATAAACGGGDDDGGGSSAPPELPAARCTPASGTSKSVAVKPKWKIGDRRTVHIQKSLEDTERDGSFHTSATAEVRVLDADKSGALLRWTSGPISLPAAPALLGDDADEVAEAVDPLRIEYATDRDGIFSELANLSSLRTQVVAMLDAIAKETDKDEEVTALRRIAESKAFLEAAMVEDLGNLHFMYGVEVERGERVDTEYELPNPFGGDPVPSNASYTLTMLRDRDGCAVFDVTIDADSDAIARNLREGQEQLTPGEAPDESDLEGLTLRHELTYAYDPGSGWIARADARKIFELGDERRTERTLIVTR